MSQNLPNAVSFGTPEYVKIGYTLLGRQGGIETATILWEMERPITGSAQPL